MLYATGQAWLESALLQLKSNASQVGIEINLIPGASTASCRSSRGPGCPRCPWELANWGDGWSYVPDYLPTGDELFQTGSFGNLGHYSDSTNDNLIKKTLAKLEHAA